MTGMNVIAIVPADEPEADQVRGFVRAARRIAGDRTDAVTVLVMGAGNSDPVAHAALGAGAHSVVVASHDSLAKPAQIDQWLTALEEALPLLITQSPDQTTLCVLPAGVIGEELAARLAVRLDGVALGRCTQIEIDGGRVIAHRQAFGGRLAVCLLSAARLSFAAIRPESAHDTVADVSAPCSARARDIALRRMHLQHPLPSCTHITQAAIAWREAPLEGARRIVCGGRGLGGTEGFAQLRALAGALGAALAGTLPAIDAGWIGVSQQVGQSGKYVTPDVYIAVAVSGTRQHMAGVGADTRIVAINSDPQADIFGEAEVGVVADWRTLVPALLERIAQHGPVPAPR